MPATQGHDTQNRDILKNANPKHANSKNVSPMSSPMVAGPERRVDGPSRSEPAFRGADEEFAESYLEIARLLLAYGKTDIARRRLKRVVDKFGNTSAGAESRNLLTSIDVTSLDCHPPQADGAVESGRSE